ncbi:MFS general substrate transporter [Ganoderma sinense ZZ0214-1]|uniref:MFS general substrate transporter n=1 Tax=Ganoderma sinense ZZ0214-1 TaxID=1077348 RepID=A0A2G8S582_9APHY|nr:MFS general substrate transporter [Ganoderma sinense ZZ0214-1]
MTPLITTEHALRAASGAHHHDGHENDIADEPHARTSALRPFESSAALDLNETGPVSSLELTKTLTSERVRRRSEIARIRPLDSPPALEPEAIELPVINDRALPAHASTTTHARGSDKLSTSFRKDSVFVPAKGRDVELMPSFPNSLAPSIRIDDADADDAGSTVPAISAAQKAVHMRKFLISFAALCFAFFLNGWNDGTVGPLLPRIQSYYGLGFATASLIFVLNAIGYITGAFANVWLTDKFGFGKCMVMGSLCQTAAYAMVAPAGPFPLMCIAFMIVGFGISLQNAHCNAFVAMSGGNIATKISFLHAAYGFGALVAPLVSTQFAAQKHWSFHYIVSTSLSLLNCTSLWWAFRGRRQEEVLAETGISPDPQAVSSNKYKQILGIKAIHLLSLFALIYVGTEVTIGGWSVTYVQDKRNGGANAGYISSGFFAGLMLGRLLLVWVNNKVGERRILFIYALLAIQLEVTVWVVPSLVENGIAVSFIGLLLGPMYPILMKQSTGILPRWLLTGCLGYIGSIGMAGSAVLPFLTGLLASRFGITSLQPFVVSMMSTLIVVWALIPRVRPVPT